jgi:hypothetical protein
MVTVPLHVISLTEYLITIEQFNLNLNLQETIQSFLNKKLVRDVGYVLLGGSSCLLVPSTLGYVGAARESRLLLFLVRHLKTIYKYLPKLLFSTLHPY